MNVRTRMAPSPTGEFHIGSMRTLLYNYALAKKENGKFLLRIEDTDQARFVEGATERLIEVIHDYGLDWDEGPFFQSQRLSIYQEHVNKLIESKHAYYCFCTKERLDELRKSQQAQGLPVTKYDGHCSKLSQDEIQDNLNKNVPYVVRLKVPKNEEISFFDEVLGELTFPSNDIDDQVLLKSDGFPTYHLAVVVDDYLMEVNYVLRGMEWLPSTPKHVLLYKAFGWELPKYAHIPLLKELGENKKLSKRHGSVSAVEFLRDGYLPDALINFLMFLGWNPGTEKEIYTLEEFCQDFDISKIHKTDLVVFDRSKLLWFNGVYIRKLAPEQLFELATNWAKKFAQEITIFSKDKEYVINVLRLVQDRLKMFSELEELTQYFVIEPQVSDEDLCQFTADIARAKEILSNMVSHLSKFEKNDWITSNLDTSLHNLISELNYKPKEAFMTLRLALTGKTATPPIFDTLEVLGKDISIQRLQKYI